MLLIVMSEIFDLFEYLLRHFVSAMCFMRSSFDWVMIMTLNIDNNVSFLDILVMLHDYLSWTIAFDDIDLAFSFVFFELVNIITITNENDFIDFLNTDTRFAATFNNDKISDFRVYLKIIVRVLKRVVSERRWVVLAIKRSQEWLAIRFHESDEFLNEFLHDVMWMWMWMFRKFEAIDKQSFAKERHYCLIEHSSLKVI